MADDVPIRIGVIGIGERNAEFVFQADKLAIASGLEQSMRIFPVVIHRHKREWPSLGFTTVMSSL